MQTSIVHNVHDSKNFGYLNDVVRHGVLIKTKEQGDVSKRKAMSFVEVLDYKTTGTCSIESLPLAQNGQHLRE